jgi:hypothetical protein
LGKPLVEVSGSLEVIRFREPSVSIFLSIYFDYSFKKDNFVIMPEISRFFGICVYMFFNDHNPPHFKVKYGEFEANILIENGNILNGDIPLSKLKLVQAWAEIHK